MSNKAEIQSMTNALIESHDGQAYFNFGEVSKIIGCGINTVPVILRNAGITVKKIGPSKRVSAYDLALFMASSRISPVDNTSRPA